MSFPYHPRSVKPPWHRDESASNNRDSAGLSRAGQGWDDSERHQSGPATGSGTEVSGYVDSPVEKRCGTCEYLRDGKFCRQETVLKDPEISSGSNGLKIVDPENGCCSFWEAGENSQQAHAQPRDLNPTRSEREKSQETSPKLKLTFY